jgi:hypothetical protein
VSETPARPAIERVIVPLDAAAESAAAIDTAARLAARARAPLHGVFVEDEDLLHLAGLPFAREITLGSAAARLSERQLRLDLKAAAERARAELAAAAQRHHVKSSFEIVRGGSHRALAGVSERDLVVAGAATRPVAGHFRVECRWLSAAAAVVGPLLLARHAWTVSGAVVALLRDRGASSLRLLEAAAQMAEARDGRLTLVCPPALAGIGDFDKWLGDRLAGRPLHLQVEVMPQETAALRRLLTELDCRLLAVEAGVAEGEGARLREFVERFACDVLIVR